MSGTTLTLYLVRHGITTWNREMRMQGHSDIELDTEGYRQAQRIARRLANSPNPPQAVFASDLKRARLTAETIADPLGLTVTSLARLRETRLGDWEGLTHDEIKARGDGELLQKYRDDSYIHRPPNAETMDEVWDRMHSALETIRHAHPCGHVAVVGHGGSLRVLLCSALSAPVTSMKHIWLSNAGLSVIEIIDNGGTLFKRIMLMNDTSHLDFAPS